MTLVTRDCGDADLHKGMGVRRKKGTTCCWQPRAWRLIPELVPWWRWTCWWCSWYLVRYWGWDLTPECVWSVTMKGCVWLWKTCLSFEQWLIKSWLHSFFLSSVSHKGEFYLERFLMRQHYTKQLILVISVVCRLWTLILWISECMKLWSVNVSDISTSILWMYENVTVSDKFWTLILWM